MYEPKRNVGPFLRAELDTPTKRADTDVPTPLGLFDACRRYQDDLTAHGVDWQRSALAYPITWAPGPGRNRGRQWLGYPVPRREAWTAAAKTVAGAMVAPSYTAITNSEFRLDNVRDVFVSWGFEEDFLANGRVTSRYFSTLQFDDSKVAFIVQSFDGYSPNHLARNVSVLKPCARTRLPRVVRRVRAGLALDPVRAFHRFSDLDAFADQVVRLLANAPTIFSRLNVVIPYEGQPHQASLISALRQTGLPITIVGVIHSCLPPVPIEYRCGNQSPDLLLVSGGSQADILTRLLDWARDRVIVTDSFRFARGESEFEGQLCLPWDLSTFPELTDHEIAHIAHALRWNDEPELRPHPIRAHDPQYISQVSEVRAHLRSALHRPSQQSSEWGQEAVDHVACAIAGSSTTIPEALERGLRVLQVTSDPELDCFHPDVWPAMELERMGPSLYAYRVSQPGALIRLADGPRPWSAVRQLLP